MIQEILKRLRQFVQSDWFLPVFISHDRDTASSAPDIFEESNGNNKKNTGKKQLTEQLADVNKVA